MPSPKHLACTNLVRSHANTIADESRDKPPAFIKEPWRKRHIDAWNNPSPYKLGEVATKRAIEAYAAYADDYYDSFETEMGLDGYFGEHARDMLSAINASLSMGFKSRFDSGAIHHLVRQLAEVSGVDPDTI